MPWITADNLEAKLLDVLAILAYQGNTRWDGIVPDAHARAKAELNAILQGRGYSQNQVLKTDGLEQWHTDLGLYWCLVKGGVMRQADETAINYINALDPRAMLMEASILVDGKLEDPAGYFELDHDLPIASGDIDDSNGVFKLPGTRRCGTLVRDMPTWQL